MPPTAAEITDESLLLKIQTSLLADDQKHELETMLPEMTQVERKELSDMIDHSFKEIIEADPELQKQVQALNADYDKKISGLMRQQNQLIRQDLEKLSDEESAGEMGALDKEINAAGGAEAPEADDPSVATTAAPKTPKAKSHFLLKLIVGLVILAGLAWAGLSVL
jgi:hypothetical protein